MSSQASFCSAKTRPPKSILTIFNWTEKARKHTLQLSALGLTARDVKASDVFTRAGLPVSPEGSLVVEQPAHSVRVLRIENLTGVASPSGDLGTARIGRPQRREHDLLGCRVFFVRRTGPELGMDAR